MIGDLVSPTHLLFIFIVALLVLGPKRLPEVGKTLGKGLRDFREAMSSYSPDALLNSDEPDQPATAAGTAAHAPTTTSAGPEASSAAAAASAQETTGTARSGAAETAESTETAETPTEIFHPRAASSTAKTDEPVDADVVSHRSSEHPGG